MSNYPRYETYIFTEIEIYFNGAKTKHKFHGDVEESFIRDVNNSGYFTRKNVIGDMVMINPSQCGVINISKFKVDEFGIKQREEQQ